MGVVRQGRELGRGARPGALVRALKSNRTASPAKIGDGKNCKVKEGRGDCVAGRKRCRLHGVSAPVHPRNSCLR